MARPPRRPRREREPRACAEDVRVLVERTIEPPAPALPSMSIHVIAERAGLSTRTVYRVLEGTKPTIPLDTADRLLLAIDKHIDDVRLVQEDKDCG